MELDAYNEYRENFIAYLMRQGLNREEAIRAFEHYEELEELEYQMMKAGHDNTKLS